MSTTSDKLNYLNNTKLFIKNELNKFGADIEVSDTFRSYVDSLETIYSEYPTVNGTGITVVLNDTKKAPLKSIALNSTELTQDGTPSPSSPVDVNVIKGSNNIKITDGIEEQNYPISLSSKNLANYLDIPNAPQWGSYAGSKYIEITGLKPNTQYTMSSNVPYNSNGQIYFNGGALSNRVYLNNNCTQTSDGNGILFFACFTNRDYYDDIINGIYYIQLEEGSTATDYTPYFNPIEYCKIGDYADQISNQFESKNLFNLTAEDFNNGQTVGAGKKVTLTLKPNTNYTLSSNAPGSSSETNIWFNGTSSAANGVFNGTSKTFSTDSNGNIYIMIRTTTISNIFSNYYIQLEEGDTATEYMPYGIIKGKWYLKKNIGEVVLDGSESRWINAGGNAPYKYTNSNIIMSFSESDTNLLSNYYPCKKWSDTWSSFDYMVVQTRGGQSIQFRNVDISTLEEFKTWLSTHNTNVYYPLATPQYIHISETDYPILKAQLENLYNNAKSYNGQNNITQTNDGLPFNIELSALMKGDK